MFKDNTKTIQTNRLILRKFTITDADDMYNNWASDTECCKYLAWNVHKNIDETKALLEAWIKAYDEGCYNWVVEIKNTHEIIGSISVMTALEKHSTCELGYCYGSKYWGVAMQWMLCKWMPLQKLRTTPAGCASCMVQRIKS